MQYGQGPWCRLQFDLMREEAKQLQQGVPRERRESRIKHHGGVVCNLSLSNRGTTDICCTPFFLRQVYGYQLLERSGMDTTETLNGRWISPPLKKGGVIRLLAVQPCEFQLTFQFRVFGCDSMQSFLDRLLVAVFPFLPAFSWVKHC